MHDIVLFHLYLAGRPFCHIFLWLQQYLSLVYTSLHLKKQAGAELGQAQLKPELDFTFILFRLGLKELTGWYSCS